MLANYAAGFSILTKEIIKKGDVIKVEEYEGTVQHINMLRTKVTSKGGKTFYIPNSKILTEIVQKEIKNKSKTRKKAK